MYLLRFSEAEVGRTIRTHRWKYAVTAPDRDPGRDSGSDHYEEAFLYDLEEDPYELQNLIGMPSHRQLAELLQKKLIREMEKVGEATPIIEKAPEIPCKQRKVFPGEENQ